MNYHFLYQFYSSISYSLIIYDSYNYFFINYKIIFEIIGTQDITSERNIIKTNEIQHKRDTI